MVRAERLTLAGLLTPDGFYLLSYAWLFGMSIWNSFFAGTIAHRTLTRKQFGILQNKIFPVYFTISIILSSLLLGLWIYPRPDLLEHILEPQLADIAQVYALGIVLVSQLINHVVIEPLVTSTMLKRHQLEKDEGKGYDQPGVSEQMKKLNSSFGALHGISSLLNLVAIFALAFHGLWIGNTGVSGR